MKRELLQLAKSYDPKKHGIAGWMMSEKLDGMRAFWDGGISRGMEPGLVPWSSPHKSSGTRLPATGLWSRYGKVIYAPPWWLDCLPAYPLDGELYLGPGRFQELMGITRRTVNVLDTEWVDLKYYVFEAPTWQQILVPGTINNRFLKREVDEGVMAWVKARCPILPDGLSFERMYKVLLGELAGNKAIVVHEQEQLPFNTAKAVFRLEQQLDVITSKGGEGVMVRSPIACWYPKRIDHLLKVKPYHDAEAVVVVRPEILLVVETIGAELSASSALMVRLVLLF